MIQVVDLTKKFRIKDREITALDSVNLDVQSGEVHGILGPNGAGKTTLFRILACLLQPTSGTARISDLDVVKDSQRIRDRVGLLCEEPSLYDKQTVHNNLAFFGELYGMERSRIVERINEISKMLSFTELLERKAGTLSKGQRQRVSIARALLHEPEVLLLDEPTANLDPETARDVRQAINIIQRQDHDPTILVSSHNLGEIEMMCARVSIIDDGRILRSGNVKDLEQEFSARKVLITFTGTMIEKQSLDIQSFAGVVQIKTSSGENAHQNLEIFLGSNTSEQTKEDIISNAVRILSASKDCRVVSVSTPELSLEQVYLKLMRDEKDDEAEKKSSEVG